MSELQKPAADRTVTSFEEVARKSFRFKMAASVPACFGALQVQPHPHAHGAHVEATGRPSAGGDDAGEAGPPSRDKYRFGICACDTEQGT